MKRGIIRDSLLFSFTEKFNAVLDPLEEGMVTHCSILSSRTPWTEEPGGLWSIVLRSQTWLKWHSIPAFEDLLTPCFWDVCVFLYVLPMYCSDCHLVCQNVHHLILCMCLIMALLRYKSHTIKVSPLEWFLVHSQNCAPLTPPGSSSAFYLFILLVMGIQSTSNSSVSRSIWWKSSLYMTVLWISLDVHG